LVAEPSGYDSAEKRFMTAIAAHRHPERDMDPPLV